MKVSDRGIVARTCDCAERIYGRALIDIRFSGLNARSFFPIVVTFGADLVELTKTFESLEDLEQAAKAACPGNR